MSRQQVETSVEGEGWGCSGHRQVEAPGREKAGDAQDKEVSKQTALTWKTNGLENGSFVYL